LSELLKWFEKRREEKVLTMTQQHLAMTMSIAEDLERAVKAATSNDEKRKKLCINRVAEAEKEADKLRREIMDELARGELSPTDREDLMHLVKRVDMVADWSRESTRILNVIPMEKVPENLKKALEAADQVERQEEKVDDLYENARLLLAKETTMSAGVTVLISQLFESIERMADWCEDACDQVRIIVVRR